MKFYLVVVIAIFQATSLFAQFPVSPNARDENNLRTGHWTMLYDSLWNEVRDTDSAKYYRLVSFEKGKPKGKVRDFYKSGQKQWDGYLISIEPDVMDGESKAYFQNGKLKSHIFYKNGVMEGAYREYAQSGVLIGEGTYVSGSLNGKYIAYHENGKVYYEVLMKDGQMSGYMVMYFDTGLVQGKGKMVNGKKEGVWEFYHTNGQLQSKAFHIQGDLNGLYEVFDENGIMTEKGLTKDGYRDGYWSFYYPNGGVKEEGPYRSPSGKEGLWKEYYEDGVLKSEGNMGNDLKQGHFVFYHPNTVKLSEGNYIDDHKKGLWSFYYDNGTLQTHGAYYQNDSLEGQWIFYFPNGSITAEGNYVRSKREGQWKYYDEHGNVTLHDHKNDLAHGIAIKYYTDGTIAEKFYYDSGALHGPRMMYYPGGQLQATMNYDSDLLSGEYTSYFPDGKIEIKCSYVQDKLHGPYIYYHENGKIYQKGTYNMGRKIIEWEEYFSNGQLGVRKKYNEGKYTWIEFFESGFKKSEGKGITSGEYDLQNGYQVKYFENGNLNSKGININGEPEGKFVYYDSITGKKTTEGEYWKGRYHGPWKFYDEKGKFLSVSYFINGFRETAENVKDSIVNLLAYDEYELALQHIDWYRKVLQRDVPKTDVQWAYPYKYLGDIHMGREEYDKALENFMRFRDEVKRLQGDTVYNFILALNGIANSYSKLKQYAESFKINDMLVASKSITDDDRVVYRYNRAINLHNLGRSEEGIESLIAEWKKRAAAHGDSSEQALYALEFVASFQYYYSGNYEQALNSYRTLMDLRQQENEGYLEAMRMVSECHYYLGDTESAIDMMTKCLEFQKKKGFDRHPQYYSDVTKLANYYVYKNAFLDGLNVLKDGLLSIQKYDKAYTYECAMLIYEASSILARETYDYKNALMYAEQAKKVLEQIGRTEINLYANVIYMLALCHYHDPLTNAQAEQYYLQSVAFNKKKYGEQSDYYFTDLLALTTYYTSGYRFAKSDSLLKTIEKGVRENLGTDHYLYASCNKRYGDMLILQYRYSESLQYYEEARKYYEGRKAQEPKMYAAALKDLAYVYDLWDKTEKAETYLKEALGVYEQYLTTQLPAYIDLQMSLADNLEKRLLYTEALDMYQKAINAYFKELGEESYKYRTAISKLAKIYVTLREYKKAEEYFKRSADLSVKYSGTPTEEHYYQMLDELAAVKTSQRQFVQAEAYYKLAREAGKPYEHDALYFFFLQRYGNFCASQGRYSLAEELLSEAVSRARKLVGENHWYFASIAIDLSKAYRNMGKHAESEAMIQKALVNAEANKEESEGSYISVLRSLAQNFRSTGRYEEAEGLHQTILQYVNASQGKSEWYGIELLDAAALYLDWGKYENVKNLTEQALSIFEETLAPDHENVLIANNQLGLLALRNNELDVAESHFRYCFEKRQTNGKHNTEAHATSLHNLGIVATRKGEFEKAELSFKKGLAIRNDNGLQTNLETEANLFDDIAILYQSWGKHELAEYYWKETLQKLQVYIQTNFPFMSDYEKTKFWERNKKDFEYFNTFAVNRQIKNPSVLADMYNYRMATKGILLSASNKLRKRIYASKDSMLIGQYHHWTELREQVAKEYVHATSQQKTQRIDSLEQRINIIEKELSLSAEDGKEDRARLITWKEVQRSLAADEAAVEFVRYRYYDNKLTDSVVYAALIITAETKANPRVVVFPNGKHLEGRAYRFYRNSIVLQHDDNLSFKNFWEPIEAVVRNKNRIYLSLDGVFNQINLKTLKNSDGKFLMENKDFVVVSNTRDIVAMKTRRKLKLFESASLIGNPKFFLHGKKSTSTSTTRDVDDIDRGSISELPGTGVEIETIDKLLRSNGWKVSALVEADASEINIKQLPSSRVIHFATHGFFQESGATTWSTSDPMLRSGILLTGAANFIQHKTTSSDENGILTAYEAANLSLEGTEMVVLSACETARGEIQQGEGVYGLQRAFITAGAESLIMSLWKVDDEATQKLMSAFYDNWMKGMEKSEALNQAQRTIRKQYPHPYYWGAFIMIKG